MTLSSLVQRAKSRPVFDGTMRSRNEEWARKSQRVAEIAAELGNYDGRSQRYDEINQMYQREPDVFHAMHEAASHNNAKSRMAAQSGRMRLTRNDMTARKDLTISVDSQNTATLFHGVNGLFADCALQRDIISTVVTPEGIMRILPAVGTNIVQTKVGLLTGYNPDTQPEPDYPCEDAPSGTYAACIIDFDFGRFARSTKTIEFDEVIKRKDSGDTSLALMGMMTSGTNGRLSMRGMSNAQVLNVVVLSEMQGVGIAFERLLSRRVWSGDPVNNTSQGGYKEFPGLDMQITTGIVNVNTGVPCPAVDSQIGDWNYTEVCDELAPSGDNIVQYLSDMEHYLFNLASKTGMNPTNWVVVMHPSLWRELTECWPCQYFTNRCSSPITPSDNNIVINAPDNIELRDRMRSGMFLPLNGRIMPVMTDDGIFEQDNTTTPATLQPGQYASTIYFVPLTVTGGFPATYVEYIDYRSNISMAEMNQITPRNMFWSDDGVFSWALEQVKWCFRMTAKVEPRVVLRTPHLAGKITNVMYQPGRKVRSPFPGDPNYLT